MRASYISQCFFEIHMPRKTRSSWPICKEVAAVAFKAAAEAAKEFSTDQELVPWKPVTLDEETNCRSS